jgi:hypothetical protein
MAKRKYEYVHAEDSKSLYWRTSFMAFGSTVTEKTVRKTNEDGETTQQFEWQWLPLNGGDKRDGEVKGGPRKIRLLPELRADGTLNLLATETEYRFLEVWMPVMVDGTMKPRRIILDYQNPWKNPYWLLVAEPTEYKSPQRKAQRHKFATNVIDLTPVLTDENGRYVYPDEKGVYRLSAQGKFVDVVKGTPTPLNKVRILESSAGDKGGRHFLQSLIDSVEDLQDSDMNPRQPHEADLLIKVTGIDIDTRRAVRATSNFAPLPEALLYAPRYDLASWTKPWHDDAVKALIAGADFNEVVEAFNIKLYPELATVEETPVAPVTKRNSKKTAKLEDEALFDD